MSDDSPIWHSTTGPEEPAMELETLADQIAYYARTNYPHQWRALMNALPNHARRAWVNGLAGELVKLIEKTLAKDSG